MQSSQAKLDAARAQLKSAQAQLAVSRIGVKEATLAAPIDGIVGKRYVVPGEKVSAEQQIVSVVDLSTLELAGSVGTHEVSLLKPGLPVEVRVEGQSVAVAGRIDRIAPAAEAGTRAIGVVVVLANKDEKFRAGQYGAGPRGDRRRGAAPDRTQRARSGRHRARTTSGRSRRARWFAASSSPAARTPASGRTEVNKGVDGETQILAARFDNLKEGTQARVVAQRSGTGASAPARAIASSTPATPS